MTVVATLSAAPLVSSAIRLASCANLSAASDFILASSEEVFDTSAVVLAALDTVNAVFACSKAVSAVVLASEATVTELAAVSAIVFA